MKELKAVAEHGMVTVMVRHVDDVKGSELGEFHPEDLRALIELFRYYEVRYDDDRDALFVDAQWVINETKGPFFEILVGEGE